MAAMKCAFLVCVLLLLAISQGAHAADNTSAVNGTTPKPTPKPATSNVTAPVASTAKPTVKPAVNNGTAPVASTAKPTDKPTVKPAVTNGALPANATSATQAVIGNRTTEFGTANIFLTPKLLNEYLGENFTAFAANLSGPLPSGNNNTALRTYLSTNNGRASAANSKANSTAPVIKDYILIDSTNALITAQYPALQNFATLLWVYANKTSLRDAGWYVRSATYTPAPITI